MATFDPRTAHNIGHSHYQVKRIALATKPPYALPAVNLLVPFRS